jgi:hypothetical protein
MECDIPFTSPNGEDIEYYNVDHAIPGEILTPSLFDDEIWTHNSAREIAWLFYKGDPVEGPVTGHTFDAPFAENTTFRIDLLRSDSSILQEVMRE